jgi:hypothetical protein
MEKPKKEGKEKRKKQDGEAWRELLRTTEAPCL